MTAPLSPAGLKARLIRAAGDWIAPQHEGNGRLCIVNYHRVLETIDPLLATEPDLATFRWQMQLLADCFNVLPLHDAVEALTTQRMPPRAVCITFDDGYRSSHDLALSVLGEFNLPATVFVSTGYIGEGNMWNDRILEAVRRLPKGQLDLRETGLGVHSIETVDDRKNTIDVLTENSKYLPPAKRLAFTMKLEELAGDMSTPGLMLTADMIRTLSRNNIEIGAHTISHPILTSLEDDAARAEIEGSKMQLEAIIGKPVRLFAYPNGKVGMDFDERHVAMAKNAGFAAAFTTADGIATKNNDRYQMPRSRPWDATPFLFGMRMVRWLATSGAAAS